MESRKSVNIIKHIFTRGNPFSFEFDTVTRTGSLANCFLRSINKKSRKVSIFHDICLSANPLPFFRLADNYAVFFPRKTCGVPNVLPSCEARIDRGGAKVCRQTNTKHTDRRAFSRLISASFPLFSYAVFPDNFSGKKSRIFFRVINVIVGFT